jgi:LmbE family N-acetylglucosaminyl deacetylase
VPAPDPVTVLHVSPHPDDEVLGAGATLLALRGEGAEVINLACSLGRPHEHDRRRHELEAACSLADFELQIHDPALAISGGDDLEAARRQLVETLVALLPDRTISLVVSPSPQDGHPGHEVVGRAVRDALRATRGARPRWWIWGLWADLPFPTLVSPFDGERLAAVDRILAAHGGEISRNAYSDLVPARATVNRVLGAEKVLGYGEAGIDGPYVELLTEAIEADGRWYTGAARILDASDPLIPVAAQDPVDWWFDAASPNEEMRARRAARWER